jgi:hypothetical protein
MPKRILSLLLMVLLLPSVAPCSAVQEVPTTNPRNIRSSSVMFIENAGQWDAGARFQAQGGPSGTVWLAEDAIWFMVIERTVADVAGAQVDPVSAFRPQGTNVERGDVPHKAVNIKLSFPGANPHPRIEPFDRLDTVVSYLIGNEPDKWRPDVPVWGGVRYVDLYRGVDLEVTSEGGKMVQRLAARPGANLDAVRLRVEGADAVTVDGDALRLTTDAGETTMTLLRVHGTQIAGSRVEPRSAQTFDVTAPYVAPNLQTAAPTLQSPADNSGNLHYSTFLGGSGSEYHGEHSVGVAVDAMGSVYVASSTGSYDFPTTPGAFDPSFSGGNFDAFVTKLNASGSGLIYATYLGGGSDDYASGIAIDDTGSAYITGATFSSNFPTTPGAFDNSHYYGFAAKLNSAGNTLVYATLLGGVGRALAIAVDRMSNAYVTGWTGSCDFPATAGAFDTSYNGYQCGYGVDAFALKLNSAGSGLIWATFLGGNYSDYGQSIAIDETGNTFVTGETKSCDFPTTPGAFDTHFNDPQCGNGSDAFVVKLNSSGSGLMYATFLGGSGSELGKATIAVAVDRAGSAYVTGSTTSQDFPTTPNAFDTSFNGSSLDVFVAKLNASGSDLSYATYLGGSQIDVGGAIAIDAIGNAYILGWTQSSNFPTTPTAFDVSHNGDYDAFVARLDTAGTTLTYSTFFGGRSTDQGKGIFVDRQGRAFVTGETESTNLPVTSGAFDTTYNGGSYDVFIAKLAVGPELPIDAAELVSQSDYLTVAPGAAVNFWINIRNTGNTTWRASDGYGWRGDDEWLGDSGPVSGETPPGSIWRLETTFTAPTTLGEYVYGFMMRHGTQEFGPYFFIKVTVIPSPDTGFRANPNGFASANRQLYRSWEMFKQFFGATNVEKPDGKRCAAAQAYFDKNYQAVAGGYSCVGFSATSMISYLGSSQPYAGSYAIAPYSRLFDEQWSTALSEPIKYYAGSQLSKQYELDAYQWLANCDSDPFGVVERIRQSLEDRNPLIMSLRANLAGGKYAHTITPYNLVDVSPTEAHVYVYDSDAPGNNDKLIRFTRDTTGWQWDYTFVGSLNGATQPSDCTDCKNMWAVKLSTMLQQGEPSEAWCSASTTQNALSQGHEPSVMSGTASGRVSISFPADGDSLIRDASGRRLGWVSGQAVSEIPGAYPVLQDSAPGYAARRGAHAPAGQYSVESSPQSTGKIDSAVFGDGRVVMIEGAASTATTMQVASGLDSTTITNPAAFTSFVTTLIEEQSLSSTVAVVSVTQPVGTSPLVLQSSGNEVTLSRAADTLNYTLAYRNSGALDFVSSQVTLGANESHILTYDGATVLLQIDRWRNGTVDETRTLANVVKRVYLPLIKR